MALLALLSEVSELFLGQLNYPDAERVLNEFIQHLPPALALEIGKAPQIGQPLLSNRGIRCNLSRRRLAWRTRVTTLISA